MIWPLKCFLFCAPFSRWVKYPFPTGVQAQRGGPPVANFLRQLQCFQGKAEAKITSWSWEIQWWKFYILTSEPEFCLLHVGRICQIYPQNTKRNWHASRAPYSVFVSSSGTGRKFGQKHPCPLIEMVPYACALPVQYSRHQLTSSRNGCDACVSCTLKGHGMSLNRPVLYHPIVFKALRDSRWLEMNRLTNSLTQAKYLTWLGQCTAWLDFWLDHCWLDLWLDQRVTHYNTASWSSETALQLFHKAGNYETSTIALQLLARKVWSGEFDLRTSGICQCNNNHHCAMPPSQGEHRAWFTDSPYLTDPCWHPSNIMGCTKFQIDRGKQCKWKCDPKSLDELKLGLHMFLMGKNSMSIHL